MAKRFITTDLFQDSWFMDLPSKYKLFWIFLITSCDYTGIWQVNFKLANFYVGDHLEPIECERILKDRIIKLSEGKYWFIPKFIEFQYGNKLNEKNSTVFNVLNRLKDLDLMSYLKNVEIISPQGDRRKDKDKDKVKDKEEVKVKDKEKDKKEEKTKKDFYAAYLESLQNYNSPFYEPMKDWLDYKGKKAYKDENSLKTLLRHLKDISNECAETAQKIVNQSIANNWKGLFELKQTQSKQFDDRTSSRYHIRPEDMDYSPEKMQW